MKVLVVRTGSPLWWDTMNSTNASESGEADTEPCIRYLKQSGYDVGYYGQIRNYETAPLEGLKLFPVDISHLPKVSGQALEDELMSRCNPVIEELKRWEPDVCIEFPGEKFTHYRPCNDNGVAILDACWRYGFPIGYMYHRTKLKRNWIIVDPMLYPRNGEMLGSWPETFPNAILSQEGAEWEQVIQGKHVRTKAVYAGCENWLTWQMKPRPLSGFHECVIAGHVHHKRHGQRTDHRTALWQGLLDKCPQDTIICGRGWDDKFKLPNPEAYHGILSTFTEVMNFINAGIGGPIVPQKLGFNTSKARFYALNGSCPYMFERDDSYKYTYDSRQRILPLDHESRWDWDKPTCLKMTQQQREDTVNTILHMTEPNFDKLHALIDDRGANSDGRYGYYKI